MDNVETLIKQIGTLKDFIDAMDSSWISVRGTEVNLAIKFDELCEELAKTKDQRGLLYLLDYFDEEFDDKYEGVLEVLQSDIGANFSLEQILFAFYEKFDQLLHKHMRRCVYISYWFLSNEMFDEFREMFNTVRSTKSQEFLESLASWCDDDYNEERDLIREDMKKW